MIRNAENTDYSQVALLCKEWFEKLAKQEGLDFECDETSLMRAFESYKAHSNGYIRVLEENNEIKGFLAGVCTRFKINCEQKIAEENYCFASSDKQELELKNDFENWARQQGSKYILNSCYDMRYTSRFRRL